MNNFTRTILVTVAAGMIAGPACAWGPDAEVNIVAAAAQLLSKTESIPLTNLQNDIRNGADTSELEVAALIPKSDIDPVGSIGAEMLMLQAVRDSRVDPYFAYRLGVLGKLVAKVTGPMETAEVQFRTLYYDDVERNIGNVNLQTQPRRRVDPAPYFRDLQREAAARAVVIEQDYREGLGFEGLAQQALSADVSRSINAVADVWYTVLRGGAQVAGISRDRVQQYYLGAVAFFIARDNLREAGRAYDVLLERGSDQIAIRKQVADMYYDAGHYSRAMDEYMRILSEEPGRRAVVERVAEYYMKLGDEAMEQEKLEDALHAYEQAVEADPVSEDAQGKLIQARTAINDRDGRLASDQAALEAALELEERAENYARAETFTEAMDLFRQARRLYEQVSQEFPEEYRDAQIGLNNVSRRMNQLRQELMTNVQSLSGTGSSAGAIELVDENGPRLAREVLRQMVELDYQSEVTRLNEEYQEDLAP